MHISDWVKRNASTILSCIGTIGVVVTAVLAVKAVPKANELKEKAEKAKQEELTAVQRALAQAPAYFPAGMVGIGTVMCIFGADALSRRRQTAMASAYTALLSTYEQYKELVRTTCGEDTSKTIEARQVERERDEEDDYPSWDVLQTFYIGIPGLHYGKFFETTMEQVARAEYTLNRIFILNGDATVNDFMDLLHLERIEGGDSIGWEAYTGESIYGYSWIDFVHNHYLTTDGMLVCDIGTPFSPHPYERETVEMHAG